MLKLSKATAVALLVGAALFSAPVLAQQAGEQQAYSSSMSDPAVQTALAGLSPAQQQQISNVIQAGGNVSAALATLANSNPQLANAVGSLMGAAARNVVNSNPGLSASIQQTASASGNSSLQIGFSSSSTQSAAGGVIGGAGGGGAQPGGGGGQPGGGGLGFGGVGGFGLGSSGGANIANYGNFVQQRPY